jgi:hypothetical protein
VVLTVTTITVVDKRVILTTFAKFEDKIETLGTKTKNTPKLEGAI